MKYVVFGACLGLCLALNINNQVNTKTRRSILDGIATNNFKPISFESITIRSNIAPESIIPSLPAGSSFGSPIIPGSSPFLYSAESLGGIQNHYDTLGAQHNLITIPVKSSGASNAIYPILNSNSPFDASLEIKPLHQNEAFGDSISVHSASNPGTIPQTLLGYDNIQSLKASSISKLSSVGKIGQQHTDIYSASIEKVPEVASFYKSGPLVPSDIPSIAVLNKIFGITKNSNNKSKDLLTERSGSTKNNDSDTSNSNLQTNIINSEVSSHQDRIATSNQKNSNLLQVEQTQTSKNKSESVESNKNSISSNLPVNTTLRLSDESNEENSPVNTTVTLSDETNEKNEVNKDVLNQTIFSNSNIPTETTSILQQEDNTDALNQTIISNSTKPIETSTISQQEVNTQALNQTIISSSTEPIETTAISQQEVNTDALNQTIISNSTNPIETETILPTILSHDENVSTAGPIRKLDANSFSNVSDILIETSNLNTTAQPEPVLLSRIQISETFNLTSSENQNEALSVGNEEDLQVISIQDDKEQSHDAETESPTNQTSTIQSLSKENSTVADSLAHGSDIISVSVKEESTEATTLKGEIEVRFNNVPESDVNSKSTDEKKAEGNIEVIKSCGCRKAKQNVANTIPSV